MRENRPYGSEGGEAKSLPYPYLRDFCALAWSSRMSLESSVSARAWRNGRRTLVYFRPRWSTRRRFDPSSSPSAISALRHAGLSGLIRRY